MVSLVQIIEQRRRRDGLQTERNDGAKEKQERNATRADLLRIHAGLTATTPSFQHQGKSGIPCPSIFYSPTRSWIISLPASRNAATAYSWVISRSTGFGRSPGCSMQPNLPSSLTHPALLRWKAAHPLRLPD